MHLFCDTIEWRVINQSLESHYMSFSCRKFHSVSFLCSIIFCFGDENMLLMAWNFQYQQKKGVDSGIVHVFVKLGHLGVGHLRFFQVPMKPASRLVIRTNNVSSERIKGDNFFHIYIFVNMRTTIQSYQPFFQQNQENEHHLSPCLLDTVLYDRLVLGIVREEAL